MEHTNNSSDLTTGVVWQRLLIFFLPIAAGTCIQQLYNAVDGLIVGRFVGTIALAAVGGSTAQIINLLIGFFVATTAGASVVIAQVYGAGRPEDVKNAAGNAMAVFTVLGILLMIVGLVASPSMLDILKTPKDTMEDAILYLRIYFLGVPFVLLLNMESNMLRSVGDSVNPFIYMVVGCVVNIVLDPILIYLLDMGLQGAAVATVIATIASAIIGTLLIIGKRTYLPISRQNLRYDGECMRMLMVAGIPQMLEYTVMYFMDAVLNYIVLMAAAGSHALTV